MNLQKGLRVHLTMDSNDLDGTKVRDNSAYNNHGTLGNNPTLNQDAVFGQALEFDGNNQYVQIPHSESTDFSGTSITVSVWQKSLSSNWSESWASVSKYSQLILGRGGGDDEIAFIIHDGDNWLPDDYGDISWGQENLDITEWHHYVGVYDQEAQEIRLYVDGQLEAQHSASNSPQSDSSPIELAHREREDIGDEHLDILMGNLRIYDRAISEEEIQALYNTSNLRGQSNNLRTNLIGYWSMENPNKMLRNRTGHRLGGELINDPEVVGSISSGQNALKFDPDEEQEVIIDEISGFKPDRGFSMSHWIRKDGEAEGYPTTLANTDTSGNSRDYNGFKNDENGENVRFAVGRGDENEFTRLSINIQENKIHHFAGVYSPEENEIRIYQNGELKDSASVEFELIPYNRFKIGGHSEDSAFWNGVVDNCRVYNSVLSEKQIKRIYQMEK